MKINALWGAQGLIFIFIFSSILTRFNIPFNLFFIFSATYSVVYLLTSLFKNNSSAVAFHYIILIYVILVFLFSKVVDLNVMDLPHFWNWKSLSVFMSALLAHLVVLKTPKNNIIKTIMFIRNISFFMIVESFFSFLLPESINFFISDFEAGNRFTSLLTPGYVFTGFFLILGYGSFLYLNPSSRSKIFFIFLLFCFAVIQTKDRTSILTFIILNVFVLYKYANSRTLVKSVLKKISFLFKVFLMLALVYFSMSNFSDRKNFMSYTSSLDRYVLFVRGINITKAALPIGGGPGSQVRLMTSEKIPFNQKLIEPKKELIRTGDFKNDYEYAKAYLKNKIGDNSTISPHNTYLDFTISLGWLGILITFYILIVQIRSFLLISFYNGRNLYFLDAIFASSIVIFMNTSFVNFTFLLLIYYKARSLESFQPEKPIASVKNN